MLSSHAASIVKSLVLSLIMLLVHEASYTLHDSLLQLSLVAICLHDDHLNLDGQ